MFSKGDILVTATQSIWFGPQFTYEVLSHVNGNSEELEVKMLNVYTGNTVGILLGTANNFRMHKRREVNNNDETVRVVQKI